MYKLISDTSCDIDKTLAKEMGIEYVPFKIDLGSMEFVDDANLDLEDYLDKMIAHPGPIKTSCPSPFDYEKVIEKNTDKDLIIITISSKLSGSFNSAKIAVEEMKKKYKDLNIELIDSKSASAGHTKIVCLAKEIMESGLDFEASVKKIREEVEELQTMFVLDNMQNLIKNGRIKKTTGLIANVLNIRPIMIAEDGEIGLYEMNRGMKKSLQKLVDSLGEIASDISERTVFISYVRAKDRAEELRKNIIARYNPKNVVINHTNGLSSGYADIGGIVLGF